MFSATVMLFSGWDTDQLSDALSPTLATCHYLIYVIFVPLVMLNLLVRCPPAAIMCPHVLLFCPVLISSHELMCAVYCFLHHRSR